MVRKHSPRRWLRRHPKGSFGGFTATLWFLCFFGPFGGSNSLSFGNFGGDTYFRFSKIFSEMQSNWKSVQNSTVQNVFCKDQKMLKNYVRQKFYEIAFWFLRLKLGENESEGRHALGKRLRFRREGIFLKFRICPSPLGSIFAQHVLKTHFQLHNRRVLSHLTSERRERALQVFSFKCCASSVVLFISLHKGLSLCSRTCCDNCMTTLSGSLSWLLPKSLTCNLPRSSLYFAFSNPVTYSFLVLTFCVGVFPFDSMIAAKFHVFSGLLRFLHLQRTVNFQCRRMFSACFIYKKETLSQSHFQPCKFLDSLPQQSD